MKKLLLFSISIFLLGTNLFCQEKKIVVKESQEIVNSTNINLLLDYQGIISGTYQGFVTADKPAELFVTYKEKKIKIPDPLAKFIIVPNADRLYNYGSVPGFVIDYDLDLNILSLTGSLLTRIEDIGHAPYTVAASSEGDFYVASCMDKNADESDLYLKKFDKNGNIKWNVKLDGYHAQNIFISSDNLTVAVVLQKIYNETMDVKFFDRKGNLIASYNNLYSITGLEFISSEKFVLVDNSGWRMCELKSEVNVLFSGKLPGNAFTNYPITVNKNAGWLIIVSSSIKKLYHLEMINIADGKTITSTEIKDTPYWEPYRFLYLEESNNLILRTETRLIKLEITK